MPFSRHGFLLVVLVLTRQCSFNAKPGELRKRSGVRGLVNETQQSQFQLFYRLPRYRRSRLEELIYLDFC